MCLCSGTVSAFVKGLKAVKNPLHVDRTSSMTQPAADPSSALMAIADDQQPATAEVENTRTVLHDDDQQAAKRDIQPQDVDTIHDSQDPTLNSQPDPSARQSDSPRTTTESPPGASADSPRSGSVTSDSESNPDSENYDMETDIIRDLRVKAYSREEKRWSTKYESARTPVFSLQVVTWNVDFMAPDTAGRLACILRHLRDTVLSKQPKPSCILLQELDSASFAEVLANAWVREHFAVTPPNTKRWCASYGVATLVSRHANILGAQMLQFYRTTMGRTALLVDVEMYVPDSGGERRIVRIANTHLESLPIGQRSRPAQLCAIADLLRGEEVTGGGVVGGDMNMIGPADEDIHIVAGLVDACDDQSAVTWGFQPPTRFPPGRLDRIFYADGGLMVEPVKVIGKGLKTKRGAWASDHYGLMTTIQLARAP